MPLQSGRNYTVEEGNEVGLTAGMKALDYGRRRHSPGTQHVSEPAVGHAGGPWGHTALLGAARPPRTRHPLCWASTHTQRRSPHPFSCRWIHPGTPSPTPSDTPLWHLSALTGRPRQHTHHRVPAWKVRGLGAPWQPGLGSPL